MRECRHCCEPILEFTFKDGKEWWHANPASPTHPRGTEHIAAPAYRRCHADPNAPYAEPQL